MVSKETIVIIINAILFLVYIVNYFKQDGASLKLKRYIMLLSTVASFVISPVPGIISLLTFITMETRYRGGGNSIAGPIAIILIINIIQQMLNLVTKNSIDITKIVTNMYGILNTVIYIIEAKTYIIIKKVEEIH